MDHDVLFFHSANGQIFAAVETMNPPIKLTFSGVEYSNTHDNISVTVNADDAWQLAKWIVNDGAPNVSPGYAWTPIDQPPPSEVWVEVKMERPGKFPPYYLTVARISDEPECPWVDYLENNVIVREGCATAKWRHLRGMPT